MSLLPLVQRVQAIAQGLHDVRRLLDESGELVAAGIRRNIDRSQVAGPFRPPADTAPTQAHEPMQPLAAYTLARRKEQGIHHSHPLKATGRTYREIGVRPVGGLMVRVGGTTRRSRKLLRFQMGTVVTGELSSDLRSDVPPRSPVGYDNHVLRAVMDKWVGALAPSPGIHAKVSATLKL